MKKIFGVIAALAILVCASSCRNRVAGAAAPEAEVEVADSLAAATDTTAVADTVALEQVVAE